MDDFNHFEQNLPVKVLFELRNVLSVVPISRSSFTSSSSKYMESDLLILYNNHELHLNRGDFKISNLSPCLKTFVSMNASSLVELNCYANNRVNLVYNAFDTF